MSDFREVTFSPLPLTPLKSESGLNVLNVPLDDDQPAGKSNVFGASLNFINSIVGAGIIGR
jgi:hypothetical protein